MTCCFGFILDTEDKKLLHAINRRPLFGKITLNFADGIIRSVSYEESTLNTGWKAQAKERDQLKFD